MLQVSCERMIRAIIRNLDNGEMHKILISKFQSILLLRKEWGKETGCDYKEYRFMDACGELLPEDGFMESILLPHTHRVKLNVEKFVLMKIRIEGYPQFLENMYVGLSITTDDLKVSICENFCLPRREMILRTNERYLVTNASLKEQGLEEGTEIVSDFIYVIHIDNINNPEIKSTVFCYASESTWKILDSKQAINYQRLHYDEENIPIRECICETLRDYGGLYQEELTLYLECKITVFVTRPRRCRKTKQYTVTRIVWPLDPIATVANETDTGPVVALWENQLYSLSTTFLKANIPHNSLIAVGVILTLTIIDKQGVSHTVYSSHTATVYELMMKIDEFIKYDPYHLKMNEKWLALDDTLQESKIQNSSVIVMCAQEYITILSCDGREYTIDTLKEDVHFLEFLSIANKVVDVRLNEKTIFECKCGSILKFASENSSNTRHSYNCISRSSRFFTAHRQIRLHIEFDNGEKLEIVESLHRKVYQIVNTLIPEDDVGIHLVEGDKVYEKNQRLSKYISPKTDEIKLSLTRLGEHHNVACFEKGKGYLETMAKRLSESGSRKSQLSSSVDRNGKST